MLLEVILSIPSSMSMFCFRMLVLGVCGRCSGILDLKFMKFFPNANRSSFIFLLILGMSQPELYILHFNSSHSLTISKVVSSISTAVA